MPETQPQYTPASGIGALSPRKEWKFAGGGRWIPNISTTVATSAAPPAPAPTSFKEETPAGTLPSSKSDLGNLTTALRAALDEASQQQTTSRMTQLSGLVEGGAAPSVINAAIGLAQSGLRQRQQDIFSDVLNVYEKERKRIEFNPDQFRSAQGGIYDLKNNKWVITPKEESGTSGRSLSFSDVQKLGLPVALVGTSWSMFQTQISSSIPPSWFKNMTEQQQKQSLFPEVLRQQWDQFREAFTGAFTESNSGISFDDF